MKKWSAALAIFSSLGFFLALVNFNMTVAGALTGLSLLGSGVLVLRGATDRFLLTAWGMCISLQLVPLQYFLSWPLQSISIGRTLLFGSLLFVELAISITGLVLLHMERRQTFHQVG
jgi:hypothetical protein